jgi:hypothetical protein
MDVIYSDKKTFEQLTDNELDDIIARGQHQPYAVEERTHRTNKKLIKITKWLLYYTIALFTLTLALLLVEVRGIFFSVH